MKWFFVLLFPFAAVPRADAGGIYWTNRGQSRVEKAGFDGSNKMTVLASAGTNVRGIALDLAGERIFYADNGADMLHRMNLDGSGRVPILATGPSSFPADIRLDLAGGHLYFCDRDKDQIRRCDLNGANPVTVAGAGTQPYYLDLDLEAGRIYWGDFDGATPNTGNIFRADLDGSNLETIVTGTLETRAVCLDKAGGMLYWVNRNAGKIQRAALADLPVNASTSPSVQTLYQGLDTPHGMVLDAAAGFVYWVDTGTNNSGGLGARGISRGRMDGSIPQEVLVDLGSEPWDIDIDPRCLTYAEWVTRYFPHNPGASADPEGNPDGDSLTNATEYGLGTHPLRRDASPSFGEIFFHVDKASESVFPAFRFIRRAGSADVQVLPQYASELTAWWDENSPDDGIPRLSELLVEALPEGLQRVTVRSIFSVASLPTQQFRLKVMLLRP